MSSEPVDGGLAHRVLDVGWDMQAMYDADGVYLDVSAASERLFGWRPDELVGTSSYDYFHPDDLAAIRAAHDHVLDDSSPAVVTYRLRCKDGSYRWVEVIGVAIGGEDLGSADRIHCATRDVTERVGLLEDLRQVTEELRDREERYRLAQHFSGIGFALVALDGTFIDVNPAMCRILGRTEDELRSCTFQELTHPADLDLDLEHMHALLEGTSDGYEIEKRYVRPEGTVVATQLNGTVVRGTDGAPRYFVAQVQDISDRRRAAEAERALESAHRVQLVGRLAGDTAHHFNNVMAEMSIDLEMLDEVCATEPGVQPDAGDFLARLRRSLRVATRITRGLQVLGGQDPSVESEFDLRSTVRDVADHLGDVLGTSIAIDLDLPEFACTVRTDHERIETALLALIVNASEANNDASSVDARIHVSIDHVSFDHDEADDENARHRAMWSWPANGEPPRSPGIRWLVLGVHDGGAGMTAEMLEHCADVFFTTRPGRAGTGLNVARNVARSAGGELVLRSEPGHGTTAELWLPATDPTDSGDAAVPVAAPEPERELRSVLVVDDRAELLDLVAIALRRAGYTVRSAAGPMPAVDLIERDGESIDVVVTDIVMPAMSGLELVHRLRTTRPGLGVVFMSGYSDFADQVASVPRSRFLAKPFSVRELVDAVEQVASSAPRERPTPDSV